MSLRRQITTPTAIRVLLIVQFIPIMLFPQDYFQSISQELWLPIIMLALALAATIQIFRRSVSSWPWHLIGFAQGFNIISRIMMLFPHFTVIQGKVSVVNTPYVVLTILSMLLSALFLWYSELPDVRMGLYEK